MLTHAWTKKTAFHHHFHVSVKFQNIVSLILVFTSSILLETLDRVQSLLTPLLKSNKCWDKQSVVASQYVSFWWISADDVVDNEDSPLQDQSSTMRKVGIKRLLVWISIFWRRRVRFFARFNLTNHITTLTLIKSYS